jgi:hypothetical protein
MKNMFVYLLLALIVLFAASCGGGVDVAAGTGTAVLSWTTPTQENNGNPLISGLTGFKVQFGTRTQNYPYVIDVPYNTAMATSVTYTLTGLPAGATY